MTLRTLHLVRHGRPVIEPTRPAHEWRLDPSAHDDVLALREAGSLPDGGRWFSSPEPKALATARLLTDAEVTVVPELREHERHSARWFDDRDEFEAAVRRAFAHPDQPAVEGWEPLTVTRDRLLPVVRRLLARHADDDLVLAGHGTAWTLLRAELTGQPPDLQAWSRLRMPDVWRLEVPAA